MTLCESGSVISVIRPKTISSVHGTVCMYSVTGFHWIPTHRWISLGFYGVPYLPQVPADNGQIDTAYRLLLNQEPPSWLYPIVRYDATTIWEQWNGGREGDTFSDVLNNSFNHVAFGSIGSFFYTHIAGVSCLEPEIQENTDLPKTRRRTHQCQGFL